MNRWLDLRRFLWEEEIAPPEEVPRGHGEEPSGVPRPLRAATRFALISIATTTLLSQVIGVRLMAPVDASPSYVAQCQKGCQQAFQNCISGCDQGKNGKACKSACQTTQNNCTTGCNSH